MNQNTESWCLTINVNKKTKNYNINDLGQLVVDSLLKVGVDYDSATCVSNLLIDAEIRGHSSHGISLLPVYLHRIQEGGINIEKKPEIEVDFGAVGTIDAHGSIGQVAATKAAEWCAQKAEDYGVSAIGIKNNNHIGMLAGYRESFVQHNIVGLLLNISGPSVAPPKASKATLGSNTFCLITPYDNQEEPFVIDLGTGVVAAGKIRSALKNKEEIPENWLIDKDGNHSKNPEDLDNGGSIPVFGEHKGLGMSLIAEVLAGILGGNTISPEVKKQRKHPDMAMNCSQLFIGLSKEIFNVKDPELLINELEHSVFKGYKTPPSKPYFPNHKEINHQRYIKENGISLPASLTEELGW